MSVRDLPSPSAEARKLYSLFARTLHASVTRRPGRKAVVELMHEFGNRSLGFVTLTMAFVGTILVYQSGLQTKRIVPDFSMLGANFLELLVRDLGSTMTGLMLATRIGGGIAAEIGSMVVTEQTDALRMSGAEPVGFLVVPRLLASVVMTTLLCVFGGFCALLSGVATAKVAFGVAPGTFLQWSLVGADDVTLGLAKAFAYSVSIPVISSYCGLEAFGGSEGVGKATTRAVVNSCLSVIVLGFILSGVAFLVKAT